MTTSGITIGARVITESDFGQSVDFVATVAVSTAVPTDLPKPTGTVTFTVTDGPGSPYVVTLDQASGNAIHTTHELAGGDHDVTAQYSGDTNYNGSTSDTLPFTISPTGTTTTLSADLTPTS
jgi:hypothetical protein